MIATTGIAFLGLIGMAGLALLEGWDGWTLIVDMVMLAFYLTLLRSIVPTLYVSWTTQPIEDE
ncbi:hypothetical protein BH11PSE6_BH11PSE6_08790 [soil metagenome]